MIFFFNFGASLVYVSKCLNLMSLPRKVQERAWHYRFSLFMDLQLLVESLCQPLPEYCLVWISICAGGELAFVLSRLNTASLNISLPMQPVLSNCTILQFCTCAYSIWPPSHMHNPKTRTCCRTQALTSRCQGRLSASLTQYCYRVGVGFPCFSCGNLSALETTRGDAVFSNRSRRTPTQRFLILLMMCACRRIPPTGIDAECLVPP